MLQRINHPTNLGDLPSFQHPKLVEVIKELDLVQDCWNLLRGDAKKTHLPKEPGEPNEAYDNRIRRSSYPSFFTLGIAAFTGVLARYELRGAPPSLMDSLQDIDGEGNSLKKWGMNTDALVLRDGGCLLMADMPSDQVESRAEEIATGRRPIFSVAERRNVLNWKVKKIGRKRVPIAVTVLEWHEVEDGEYGHKLEPRYRVMKGGSWQLWRIKADSSGSDKGGFKVLPVEGPEGQGVFLDYRKQPLEYPPVVWYGASGEPFGEGNLPLLALANLTLDWFREYSDLAELLHRCALPVTWIRDKGRMPNTPFFLGPNSLCELRDDNSAIGFAEPTGSSLDKHIQHLMNIEKLIDRNTLSFLFSGSGDRTATQAELESAQMQANIAAMAESKSSCWQSLFELWGTFTGDMPETQSGLDLLPGIIDKPVDEVLLNCAGVLYDKGLLMRETVTYLAQKRGMLPPGIDGAREAELLAAEDARQEAKLNPPTPDVNDLAGDNVDAQGLPLN